MNRFENTQLWQRTLAMQLDPDPDSDGRRTLRNSYEAFRSRAQTLAGEIARELPQLTVHDISHIDALWEMADLVAGPDYSLTPTEAFVLGGAILIHDLGMALSAYAEGPEGLYKTPAFRDSLASALKQELGRPPTQKELQNPSGEATQAATGRALRILHAEQAEKLGTMAWKSTGSGEYYLIEDAELRGAFGRIIGLLAHSHWWPVSELPEMLPAILGAPAAFPNSWSVDPLKLACLLRLADIAHLDERRAPGFLKVLRRPEGPSEDHWIFQEKLYQPRLESGRLVFTAKQVFCSAEASSWWLCFDVLTSVDNELRQVDSLLADLRRERLAARGVAYVEDPKRLAKLIPTEDWYPVDTQIRVTAVARLVSMLGGEKLYGRNLTVPLREMIQNAADAVRARRLIEERDNGWGEITVKTSTYQSHVQIEIDDTGVGMSREVLCGPFLDFGHSFWGSEMMHQELPGLEAKGFQSTGKYGIGFFSVFMWADRVKIETRRYDRAHDETLVLEFTDGLTTRPVLRRATPSEFRSEGGTRITAWLKKGVRIEDIVEEESHWGGHRVKWTLQDRCGWLCPCLDVNLSVAEEEHKPTRVISAGDWTAIDGVRLIRRINGPILDLENQEHKAIISKLAKSLSLLRDEQDRPVGRVCVCKSSASQTPPKLEGVVVVGGFRGSYLTGLLGVLIGEPVTAARDLTVPLVAPAVLKKWTTAQTRVVADIFSDPDDLCECARTICLCRGSIRQMRVIRSSRGLESATQISRRRDIPNEVALIWDSSYSIECREHGEFALNDGCYVTDGGYPCILQTGLHHYEWPRWPHQEKGRDHLIQSVEGVLLTALAKAWGCDALALYDDHRGKGGKDRRARRVVGVRDGKEVTLEVDVLRNPRVAGGTPMKSRRRTKASS